MKKITFIGAGNMARAIISGLIADGYDPKNISATGLRVEKMEALKKRLSINAFVGNTEGAKFADVIVLCVEPQRIREVCLQIQPELEGTKKLVISIAAGTPLDKLERYLGKQTAVVRTMPNIASMVGAGATGLCANQNVSEAQKEIAESIFRAVGIVIWLDDGAMDTVTAVSGSGPAYILYVMEVMQQSAVDLGLSEKDAKLLIMQTVLGTAKMAFESNESFATIRKNVTVPNGTTEKAIEVLEANNLQKSFADAMQKAHARAQEKSREE